MLYFHLDQSSAKPDGQPKPVNHDIWDVPVHDSFPRSVRAWVDALKQVDHSYRVDDKVYYWLPPPRLFVSPTDPQRRWCFCANWLRLCEPWLHVVSDRSLRDRFGDYHQQGWRAFLGLDDDSATNIFMYSGQHKVDVLEYFGEVFEISPADPTSRVSFFGMDIPDVDSPLLKKIYWEISELSFRVDLWELDQCLVSSTGASDAEVEQYEINQLHLICQVFRAVGDIRLAMFPLAEFGLNHTIPQDRAQCLEALRAVLVRWPGCPQSLKVPLNVYDIPFPLSQLHHLERDLAEFYVKMAYQKFSRPASIPFHIPL